MRVVEEVVEGMERGIGFGSGSVDSTKGFGGRPLDLRSDGGFPVTLWEVKLTFLSILLIVLSLV